LIGLLLLLCGQTDTLPPVWGTTETVAAVGSLALAGALLPLDESIAHFATTHHSEGSRTWAAGGKFFGSGYALPIPAGLFFVGKFGDSPRLERASQNALEAWVLTQLVVQPLKYGFHRHRPSTSRSAYVFDGPSLSNDDADLSFSSGHSASAWGWIPAYALEYSDHPWLAAALYAVALSTSLSRVHDNQHWSSDVAVSAGVGWITNRMVRSWNLRRDSKVALVPDLDDRVGIRLVWTP
jgi:membrane-associated phospholipid phosphatase